MHIWRIPKVQMAEALLLVFVSAVSITPSFTPIVSLIVTLVSVLVLDYTLVRLRKIPPFLLSAAVVTGFIIALLQDPALPHELLVVAGVAILSKDLLRFNNNHIFNPAGLGLFVAALLFSHNISWWGVSFQRLLPLSLESLILFLVLLVPGYVSVYRMRRYRIILPFLLVYTLGLLFLSKDFSLPAVLSTATDPTMIFFSLVMLPEPMTTPSNHQRQVIFGIFVAALTLFLSRFQTPDPLVLSLLIGNLVFFKFK